MPGVIVLGGSETATNSDILQGTRLQNAPSNGVITFETQQTVNVPGTNCHNISVQLPSGDTPLNSVPVPAGTVTTAGILDERTYMKMTFPVRQGGHVVFSTALTGTSTLSWRAIFTPTA